MNRLLLSALISLTTSVFVFFSLNDFGISWDEPIYFRNGDRYITWIKYPTVKERDWVFRVNEEDAHPPFRKLVSGITHEILTNNLGILDNTRGYRISTLLFVFPLVSILAYVAIGRFGVAVGVLVPFLFSFLPHVFYLSALSTLDYGVAALWFLAVITGLKGAKNNRWLMVSGIFIGLTMLTKLHGFLLFIPILSYLAWKKNHLSRLISLVAVSIIVYIVGWPWMWSSPVSHLQEYFRIQSVHGGIPIYVLGRFYEFAPWWYTPLMFLTTTPAIIVILFFVGSFVILKKRNSQDTVFLLNALYPIIFFSLPGVYRYDWIRLFLPAYPFVALVVGRAIFSLPRKVLPIVYVLFLTTIFYAVIRIHPFESSYYNEFVGGVSGAHSMGLETEFWGNANLKILPWMNEHASSPMCVWPTTHPFYYYQAMGQLNPEVKLVATREDCDFLVVSMRQGLFVHDSFVAEVVKSQIPVSKVSVEGVTVLAVYNIKK